MIRASVAALALLAAGPSVAATVQSCDSWVAHAQNVVWDDPTRIFANGDIRLVALDTGGEPVCCSAHLMVLYLEADAPYFSCTLVSQDGSLGWAAMSLSAAQASYDPAVGLTVAVPVGIYNGVSSDPGLVSVTINRATGVVQAR